jgi:hypothetical protein
MAERHAAALITGASSGIGLELARVFAADHHDLVLVARRGDALERLAGELKAAHGVAVQVWPEDLADPEAPGRLHARAEAEGVAVDILVNNAGFGTRGAFAEIPLERQLEMIAVNIRALTELTRRFIADMQARGRGRILNVASLAGLQPGPYLSVYAASKAYDLMFTLALAEELAGSSVTVTCLAPGATATEWQAVAGIAGSHLERVPQMSAAAAARAGYDGLVRGDRLVIPGLQNKFAALAMRLLPQRLLTRLIARLMA